MHRFPDAVEAATGSTVRPVRLGLAFSSITAAGKRVPVAKIAPNDCRFLSASAFAAPKAFTVNVLACAFDYRQAPECQPC